MSTKTFKSTEGGFSIGIHPVTDGVQFRITNRRGNYQQFTTPASVAAEQALAILEAAGVPMQGDSTGRLKAPTFTSVSLPSTWNAMWWKARISPPKLKPRPSWKTKRCNCSMRGKRLSIPLIGNLTKSSPAKIRNKRGSLLPAAHEKSTRRKSEQGL